MTDCALQVNSDLVYYSRSKDGTLEPVKVNTSYVGRMVLTKAVLDKGRRDIINNYKFPEGRSARTLVHAMNYIWYILYMIITNFCSQPLLKNEYKIS